MLIRWKRFMRKRNRRSSMWVFFFHFYLVGDLNMSQDKNLGLITQALTRAPRWVLKKLTSTYVTLHLSDIGRAIKIDSEDEVRALLLSMVHILVSSLIPRLLTLPINLVDRSQRYNRPNLRLRHSHILWPDSSIHQRASWQRSQGGSGADCASSLFGAATWEE